MLALGFTSKSAGLDATMGLAFASTGMLFPFFSAMLGWLGVALTGSDTSSNVLFGGLQKITAQQLGLNPILTAAANTTGGVMGKMIDAQSLVVASVATNQQGEEGTILRYVFFHSLTLAAMVGVVIFLYAKVLPENWMPLAPRNLTYVTQTATYSKGAGIVINIPSTQGGAVTSYSVTPALPAGLTLNPTKGEISGTPTVDSGTTTYTVTASNWAGSIAAPVTIAVTGPRPSAAPVMPAPAPAKKNK
jgi:hypothetical protein